MFPHLSHRAKRLTPRYTRDACEPCAEIGGVHGGRIVVTLTHNQGERPLIGDFGGKMQVVQPLTASTVARLALIRGRSQAGIGRDKGREQWRSTWGRDLHRSRTLSPQWQQESVTSTSSLKHLMILYDIIGERFMRAGAVKVQG